MKLNFLSIIFCFLVFIFAACTKITSTDIGTGLIPAIDGVITKDTIISVDVKNAGDTTINPLITDDHVVGFVNDPLFGTTDAKINFQVSLPSSLFTFESTAPNLFLDSVVLVLSYKGLWGDSTQPVSLHVNQLDAESNSFVADSTYDAYSFHGLYNSSVGFNVSSELTNGGVFVDARRLADSAHNFEDSGINMIRLKLNDVFGTRLLNYDTTNAYKTDSVFKADYLKGLQVSADAGGGNALLKIGLTDVNTKLALYYKYHPVDSVPGLLKPSVKYFLVNSSVSAHSNNIVRNRTSGQINNYLPSTPNTNDDLVFIQAGPGTYATIKIDSLGLAKEPNIIVHRAELLMEQATDLSDTYLTPPNLFLLAKDDTSRFLIPGFDTSSISTADAIISSTYLANYLQFGGIPKHNVTNNSLYAFNISRYVQGVVTKHNAQHSLILYAPYNEPFKLLQSTPYTTARGYVASSAVNTAGCGRVRLYGGGSDVNNTHRMRLHIVYSVPH